MFDEFIWVHISIIGCFWHLLTYLFMSVNLFTEITANKKPTTHRLSQPRSIKKMKSSAKMLFFRAVTFLFLTTMVSCEKTVREASDRLAAEAVLVEAMHTPSKQGMVYGGHFNIMKGKWEHGLHWGKIPEVNKTTFQWSESNESFSTESKEICTKSTKLAKGTKVILLYRELYDVTYDGEKVIEKKYVGLELIDVGQSPH